MAIGGRDLCRVADDGPSRMFHFKLEDRGESAAHFPGRPNLPCHRPNGAAWVESGYSDLPSS